MKNLMVSGVAVALAVTLMSVSLPASAAVDVDTYGTRIDPPPGQPPFNFSDPDGIRVTITCVTTCEGWSYTGGSASYTPQTFDASNPSAFTETSVLGSRADLYVTNNSADATEIALVNKVTGSTFTTITKPTTDTIVVNAGEIFAFTTGNDPRVAIYKNTSATSTSVSWTQVAEGAGLSHWSRFDMSPVPLPAAAWLLLAGIGGIAALSRKRRASA